MPTIVERFRERFSPLTEGGSAPGAGKPSWATSCLNCGAPLSSAFCADCGQRALPPHPTIGELAGDAFSELSGWDGKFIETFRLLVLKPGELTRQFIDGKRVRYVASVRLYLTLSLIYFITAAAAPVVRSPDGTVTVGAMTISATDSKAPAPTGPEQAAKAALDAQSGILTAEDRKSALEKVEKAPRIIKPILNRVISDPVGFRHNIFESLPRVMFVLVPMLGLIIGLFYRARHYPQHLYFAIHLASFVFLAMTIVELTKFTHVFLLYAVLSAIGQLSIPVYTFFALRRVYGESVGRTIAKELGIAALYSVTYGIAILCVAYYAAVAA